MTVDCRQVKTRTIPEGSVTKITDSSGNRLWQSASWHTIWEGSVTQSSNSMLDITSLSNLSGIVKIRVTWSCSTSGGSGYTTVYYNNNGWDNTTTTKPDSPFQFDLNADSSRSYIVGCNIRNKSNDGADVYLYWASYDKTFYLSGGRTQYLPNSVKASMTVTKIEQYY